MRRAECAYTKQEIPMRPPASPKSPELDGTYGDECPSAVELAAWIDDRLAERERESVEVHVSRCARCCDLVAGIRSESFGDLDDERVSASVLQATESLMPDRSSYRFIARCGAWGMRLGAAAAALAIAWGGYSVGASFNASTSTAASGASPGGTIASTSDDALTFGLLNGSVPKPSSEESDALDLALRSLLLEVIP
jgi:hypothetical protein